MQAGSCSPAGRGAGRHGGRASRDGGRAEVGGAASAARRTCCSPRGGGERREGRGARSSSGSSSSRMAADLRFRLAEPLQLVARRNEKSGVELSRFVAKQVRSGRCGARWQPPGVRSSLKEGLVGATVERRERTLLPPPCGHLLPAAWCVPDPPGCPWPAGSRREANPRSLSLST